MDRRAEVDITYHQDNQWQPSTFTASGMVNHLRQRQFCDTGFAD